MSQAHTDKYDRHFQQQLSAMLDGELAPDQAKFMLRRLEHDAELAACWERWQVCGDVMRGCHEALLPRDFSQRVADAISDRQVVADEAASATGKSRWARWGGGAALAATVAMVAVLVARQLPGVDEGATAIPAQVATNTVTGLAAVPNEVATQSAPDAVGSGKPLVPAAPAAVLATAVATADMPRRAAERRSRAQSQRAAVRIRRRADDAPAMVAVNAAAAATAAPASAMATRLADTPTPSSVGTDPFVPRPPAHGRPWPRAIAPTLSSGNTFTASFGGNAAPFHPFEPSVELQPAQSGDGRLDADTGPR